MPSSQYIPQSNALLVEQLQHRLVSGVIPNLVLGVFGTIQLFLWIVIIVLEIISVYYDAGRGTIYAGFWCSIIFFITWVAMFCYRKFYIHNHKYGSLISIYPYCV